MSLLQLSTANTKQETKEKEERYKQEKEQYQKWLMQLSDNALSLVYPVLLSLLSLVYLVPLSLTFLVVNLL